MVQKAVSLGPNFRSISRRRGLGLGLQKEKISTGELESDVLSFAKGEKKIEKKKRERDLK